MINKKTGKSEKILKLIIITLMTVVTVLLSTLVILLVLSDKVEEEPYVIILITITALSLITAVFFYWIWNKKSYISERNSITVSSEITSMSEKLQKRGVINYDKEGKIIFLSRWLFSTDLSKYLGKRIEKLNIDIHKEGVQKIELDNNFFNVIPYNRTRTLIIFDVTKEEMLKKFITNNKTAIVLIKVLFSSTLDEVSSLKNSIEINNIISEWAEENNSVVRAGQAIDHPILVIGTWEDLKNAIYEETIFKQINKSNNENVALSIGVAYSSNDYKQILENAKKASVVALNRGGNQTVLLNSKNEYEYIGSSSQGKQTDSKSKIKLYTNSFFEDASKYKNIFVTSHKAADIDALASSIAIAKAFINKGKQAKIILSEFDSTTMDIYKKLPLETKKLFVTEKQAIDESTKKTSLIIADVSEAKRIQAPELLKNIPLESIYIIDHHRVGEQIINSRSESLYVDTTASSVSEIITEMIFLEGNEDCIDESLATLLISGIYLDTNTLKRNSSSRTHDAISNLIKKGGDAKEAGNILSPSSDEITILNKALSNAKKIKSNILFSVIPESIILTDSKVAQISNNLLNYKDINITIVLARIKNDLYKVSIRSTEKINSQLIAEKLGGGGHFNTAAATFSRKTTDYKKLQMKIRKIVLEKK